MAGVLCVIGVQVNGESGTAAHLGQVRDGKGKVTGFLKQEHNKYQCSVGCKDLSNTATFLAPRHPDCGCL